MCFDRLWTDLHYDADYVGRRVNRFAHFDCVPDALNSNFIGFDVDCAGSPKSKKRFLNKEKRKQ